MSQLRFPLKEYLDDPVDEAALHRIAQRIEAPLPSRNPRRVVSFVFAGVATVGIAAAALSFAHIHRNPGPLVLADGREFTSVDANKTSHEIRLSDGSSIRLWPGAHVAPLESSGRSFSAIVTDGRADFEVQPGGPRHWTVECGLATVEVVGTAFTCDRAPHHLRVEVRHGVVLVRGDRVPDRAQRLSAGESLEITEPVSTSAVPASAAATASLEQERTGLPSHAPDASTEGGVNAKPQLAAARPWRELARHGRNDEAYATLGADGIRNESKKLGVNDLLALADVARLSGHPAEAVVPLQRVLTEFSGDAQAPLAAFALGRLELDSLGHARAAVTAFRRALSLGVPRGLREDVLARLVEAYAKSGDTLGAERAADAYLEEFPSGRHARAVRGWRHSFH
jgi:transmembrane sensor